MTAKTITQLTALAAADAASADVLPIVDVSDTTMAATGTTKKITLTDLQSAPVSAGTANSVLYLNGSKVATSGSALMFDGNLLEFIGGTATNRGLAIVPGGWGGAMHRLTVPTSGDTSVWSFNYNGSSVDDVAYGTGYVAVSQSSVRFGVGATGAAPTEQMRLTSTGLGIGTSSPSAKLAVGAYDAGTNPLSSTYGPRLSLVNTSISQSGSGSTLSFQSGTGTNPVYAAIAGYMQGASASGAYGDIVFGTKPDYGTTSPVERMRLNANGNLGLGVTPSAWTVNSKAIQVSSISSVSQQSNGTTNLMSNAYESSANSFSYMLGAYALRYNQSGATGQHQWHIAPSGTAGNAISFTQAMTLNASGNLLVGTTDSGYQNASAVSIEPASGGYIVCSHATGAASGNLYMAFGYGGSGVGSITQSGTTAVAYNTSSDYRLKDNQSPLTGSGSFIDALKPKTWTWKADGTKGVGFIAHEVQEVSPTSVVGEKDAMRVEQYEVSPAVPATYDEQGNELTPAVEAVMGEREVPAYQAMEYGSAEFIANIVAELQSLRKRVAALEA